jgi:hypothetical protein
MADGVTVKAQGLKEIDQMFRKLPKDVNSVLIWGQFWKKVSKPLQEAAEKNAPLLKPASRKNVSYPRTKAEKQEGSKNLKIARGTLKNSVIFYRTSASRKKDVHGAYIGPRVKGKYKKNMGGFYGAFVEYGHRKRGGGMTKANPWMAKSFAEKSGTVLSNGFKDATDIFVKAVRRYEKKMAKNA